MAFRRIGLDPGTQYEIGRGPGSTLGKNLSEIGSTLANTLEHQRQLREKAAIERDALNVAHQFDINDMLDSLKDVKNANNIPLASNLIKGGIAYKNFELEQRMAASQLNEAEALKKSTTEWLQDPGPGGGLALLKTRIPESVSIPRQKMVMTEVPRRDVNGEILKDTSGSIIYDTITKVESVDEQVKVPLRDYLESIDPSSLTPEKFNQIMGAWKEISEETQKFRQVQGLNDRSASGISGRSNLVRQQGDEAAARDLRQHRSKEQLQKDAFDGRLSLLTEEGKIDRDNQEHLSKELYYRQLELLKNAKSLEDFKHQKRKEEIILRQNHGAGKTKDDKVEIGKAITEAKIESITKQFIDNKNEKITYKTRSGDSISEFIKPGAAMWLAVLGEDPLYVAAYVDHERNPLAAYALMLMQDTEGLNSSTKGPLLSEEKFKELADVYSEVYEFSPNTLKWKDYVQFVEEARKIEREKFKDPEGSK